MSENPLLVPELRELLTAGDFEALKEVCAGAHPATVAEFLSPLEPDEIWSVLSALDIHMRADIFSNLDIDHQVELVSGAGRQAMARLIEEMAPDDRVDLVQQLDENVRDEIMPLLAQAERRDIRRLASYPENTAGAEMTTDYVALPETLTAGEAIERLRRHTFEEQSLYAIYVVDEQRRLRGVVELPALVLARPQRTLGDIMLRDVVSVRADADREDAVQLMRKYDLFALPVVNGSDALVGIVTADDILDIAEEEVDEDIYRLGAAGEPATGGYLKTSALKMAQQRVTWLLLLVLVGFVSGAVMESFGDVLHGAWAVILASFLPMLAGSGGNAGSQATMVVVRGLATGEVALRDFGIVLRKELMVAVFVGVAMAILAAARAVLVHGNWRLAITVAAAMFGVVAVAKTLGSMMPILLKRIGLDPALMSTPLISTIMDVTTIFLYLELARLILVPVMHG